MREYFRYFRWVFITIAVLAAVLAGVKGVERAAAGGRERTNTECAAARRVFDYADVLTDKEEKKLETLIAGRERQTGCDIVLVTLCESLEEYAREIEPEVPCNQFVRIFAEEYYRENKFGYNRPGGDGVILVDNWFREADGHIHTWLWPSGIVEDTCSYEDIDRLLDDVYRYVENDPYRAYKTYVNDFYRDMTGRKFLHVNLPGWLPILAGIIAAVIFIPLNWTAGSGSRTTTAVTYVNGGREHFVNKQDIFLRKSVVRRHIETSGAGGGHGGGHRSGGGGGSHGGGGHSR
ncbi:MAG: TPM domain-containing protein [Blautia sp.]|nr:TPM domain-containing protein [Blautia sp.]MCM1201743.1 TPM domain-containing protein [Bacteroides fragilis]